MIRSAHVRLSSTGLARRTALGVLAPSLAALMLSGCGGNDFQPSTTGSAGSTNTGGEAAGGQGGQATGGEGTGGSGEGGGGEGGSPVVTPPGCIPSENDGEPVPADCGIFVDAANGSDDNDGSQADPVQSLAHAITLANGEPIYACASETAFEDALEVLTDTSFFGGLDCEEWTYLGADAKTMIATAGSETDAPVTVSGTITVQFDTFHIEAPDAIQPGQSSIAMFVDGAFVDLVNVELVAGDGAHGLDGATATPFTASAPGGSNGTMNTGGNGGVNGICGTTGGKGGNGSAWLGSFSTEPQDGGAGDAGQGAPGGAGHKAAATHWSCSFGKGNNGAAGTSGLSGDVVTALSLTPQGLVGGGGAPGTAGVNGQSGGGAGGGQLVSGTLLGPGGGGGGAGGCGGAPGLGGMAGGSSIALALVGAEATMLDVVLRVGKGGNGGDGGAGQQGQSGGPGGAAGSCTGGYGGSGGHGGNGGGSHGGSALGIAAASSEVSGMPIFDTTLAQAGLPGQGGVNNSAPAGQAGTIGEVVLQKTY